jgi:hypothetical protein
LTHYAINISPPPANSHRFLIGPPLFVVSLFCFAFVLMQPHNQSQAKTAAASHPLIPSTNSSQPALSQSSQADLPKLSQEQPMTVTPAPTATGLTTTPMSTISPTLSTTGSQSSNTGGTASLQPAKPNSQTDSKPNESKLNSLIKGLNLIK